MAKIVRRHNDKYNFFGDKLSGVTFRWGKTLKEIPFMAPWPELADISISNRCSHGCHFCYRNSTSHGELMSVNEYKIVLNQLTSPKWGTIFQVALGGGEPTEHPQLIQILEETAKRGIIPNLTTNGITVTNEHISAFKKMCGAVAFSIHEINPKEIKPIMSKLVNANIRTNIHFLLTKKSITDAIEILKGRWDSLFRGLNAVIFLTHKAIGRASEADNLVFNENLRTFLHFVNTPLTKTRFGFDACLVPILYRYTNVDTRFIDSCECGFFSIYIDEKMTVKPCSFSIGDEYSFSLHQFDFETIWQTKLEKYRKLMREICHIKCDYHDICRGGCLFHNSINLCCVNV